jgi:hypothetical protein
MPITLVAISVSVAAVRRTHRRRRYMPIGAINIGYGTAALTVVKNRAAIFARANDRVAEEASSRLAAKPGDQAGASNTRCGENDADSRPVNSDIVGASRSGLSREPSWAPLGYPEFGPAMKDKRKPTIARGFLQHRLKPHPDDLLIVEKHRQLLQSCRAGARQHDETGGIVELETAKGYRDEMIAKADGFPYGQNSENIRALVSEDEIVDAPNHFAFVVRDRFELQDFGAVTFGDFLGLIAV